MFQLLSLKQFLSWVIIVMYKLRPHHLLCMRLFKGKGYSDEFTCNMQKCIDNLVREPNVNFELVDGCDDICLHCPNLNDEHQCSQGNESVLHKDLFVLKTLRLKVASNYSYNEINDRILRNMTSVNFKKCCSTCRWYAVGLCSYDDLILNITTNQ